MSNVAPSASRFNCSTRSRKVAASTVAGSGFGSAASRAARSVTTDTVTRCSHTGTPSISTSSVSGRSAPGPTTFGSGTVTFAGNLANGTTAGLPPPSVTRQVIPSGFGWVTA